VFKSSISHCAVNKGCGAKHGRRRRRRRVVPGLRLVVSKVSTSIIIIIIIFIIIIITVPPSPALTSDVEPSRDVAVVAGVSFHA